MTRVTDDIDAVEKAEAQAEDVLSAATEEQAGKAPPKKMNGADFLSQPLFVASAGVGLGWLTGRAFGAQNALHQDEANGIAAGILRIAGRHFLKEVDMQALSEANGDINDLLLIVRGVGNYIGRKMQESAQRESASAEQAQPTPRQQSAPRQNAPTARQNAPAQAEAEAAFIQDQMTAAIFSMPSLGEAA